MTPVGLRPEVRVSIDAGQSSIRVRVAGADQQDLYFAGVRNDRSTVVQIAQLLAAHGAWGAESIAVGLTGFENDPTAPNELLVAASSARLVSIAHDSVTGYLGANGESHGVVAAVGTGVVVLGVGPDRVARVDGWGAMLGDAGSAYWIGRAGLEAVLRCHDGRGQPTILSVLAKETFGDLNRLYLTIQSDADRVARVAAFARAVTAYAETDGIAAAIVDRAAAELADSIAAAQELAGVNPKRARLSGTGQTLTAPTLATHLATHLGQRITDGRLEPPLGEPIDGVERLHTLRAEHPLGASIFTAVRGRSEATTGRAHRIL